MANAGQTIRRIYDRLLAAIALLLLLGSLAWLIVYTPVLRTRQDGFDRELASLKPRHEQAQPADKAVFEDSHRLLREPFQTGAWSNRTLLPELRVRCVNCERPIPYTAVKCAFCRAEQPAEKPGDIDQDGLPDEWENRYRLNPRDRDDATADVDEDGFTNQEEYDFQTDPRDPGSFPSPLAKVVVLEIKPIPFELIFKAVNRLGPQKLLFQVNLRNGGRTYWKEIGDVVEDFKLIHFDEKGEDGKPILTLQRGDKTIKLIKGQVVPHNEYEIVLQSNLNKNEIRVRVGGQFTLKGVAYEVKGVDSAGMRVLIGDPVKKSEVWISRQASSEPPPVRQL